MTARRTYLDHNATTPLVPAARTAMIAAMDAIGNPSSVHAEGRAARAIVENARDAVAALVGASAREVVFTAGATEANAWVLAGGWDTILTSGIEHDSILAAARNRHATGGGRLEIVDAGEDGVVDADAVATCILKGSRLGRTLLSVQAANNETGVIQPVAEIAQLAREHGIVVHTDAVQAAGRTVISFDDLGVDAMSLSAHKLGGPKGVGALVVRDRMALSPLIAGGQERRRRGGTENVIGIAGFGAAAAEAMRTRESWARVAALRDRLEREAVAACPETQVVAQSSPRLANTSLLAHAGLRAETAVIRLDLAGLSVSAGAACSSGKVGASHVLIAMGLPADLARGGVRVSLGLETTDEDIDTFIAAWRDIAPACNGKSMTAAG